MLSLVKVPVASWWVSLNLRQLDPSFWGHSKYFCRAVAGWLRVIRIPTNDPFRIAILSNLVLCVAPSMTAIPAQSFWWSALFIELGSWLLPLLPTPLLQVLIRCFPGLSPTQDLSVLLFLIFGVITSYLSEKEVGHFQCNCFSLLSTSSFWLPSLLFIFNLHLLQMYIEWITCVKYSKRHWID